MAKRKKGNAPLWSVARVQDPRFPGITVRVTELTGGGGVLYACYRRHGKQTMRSLKLRRKDLGRTAKAQKAKARAIALDVIEALATPQQQDSGGDDVETADVLTLGALADLYEKHGLPGVGLMYARAQVTKVRRFVEFLGADKPVVSLCKSDIKRFAVHRAKDSVGLNTVAGDLAGLKIALGFAREHRRLDGSPLLESDPLQRVRLPREEPKRPWCAPERYAALQGVANQLPAAFGVVLAIAWETGHRVGAILKLQWKDVSFEQSEHAPSGTIRWYAGERSDRKKKDATVPLNADARKALEGWRAVSPGVGGASVFPAVTDPSKALGIWIVVDWLKRAEELAGLEHQARGGFHEFRRGWATVRKHLSDTDVAAAGGWSVGSDTLKKCYQHPDAAGILAAVNGGG